MLIRTGCLLTILTDVSPTLGMISQRSGRGRHAHRNPIFAEQLFLNPYESSSEDSADNVPAKFNQALLRRHLISMLIAGVVLFLLPRVVKWFDATGQVVGRFRDLPFMADPFTLAGAMLALWAVHLLSVMRKCRK